MTVFGELDVSTAPRLRPAFEQALEADGDVELDLRGCTFVDSSGIATLVWAAWRLKEDGRKLLSARRPRPGPPDSGPRRIAGHAAIVIDQP